MEIDRKEPISWAKGDSFKRVFQFVFGQNQTLLRIAPLGPDQKKATHSTLPPARSFAGGGITDAKPCSLLFFAPRRHATRFVSVSPELSTILFVLWVESCPWLLWSFFGILYLLLLASSLCWWIVCGMWWEQSFRGSTSMRRRTGTSPSKAPFLAPNQNPPAPPQAPPPLGYSSFLLFFAWNFLISEKKSFDFEAMWSE